MLRPRLQPQALLVLFLVGAAGGLVGDDAHVESGTTRYLSHAFPSIWRSELWFPLLVGGATCAIAELRLALAPPRSEGGVRDGAAAIAAVVGFYVVTALLRHEPIVPATSLCIAIAVLIAALVADGRAALLCGLAAALVGPVAEMVLVAVGVSEYEAGVDGLFGVAPWLPALYFAFGVVAARLAELLTPRPVTSG